MDNALILEGIVFLSGLLGIWINLT